MSKLRYIWSDRKYLINKQIERLHIKIAWKLPKSITKWAFYRVLANASGSKYPDQVVPELTWQQAADRWEEK